MNQVRPSALLLGIFVRLHCCQNSLLAVVFTLKVILLAKYVISKKELSKVCSYLHHAEQQLWSVFLDLGHGVRFQQWQGFTMEKWYQNIFIKLILHYELSVHMLHSQSGLNMT